MVATVNIITKRPVIGPNPNPMNKVLGITRGGPTITTQPTSTLSKVFVGLRKPAPDPAVGLSETNEELLRKQGLDLKTIQTPSGKRKKRAGLRGGEAQELATLLGE